MFTYQPKKKRPNKRGRKIVKGRWPDMGTFTRSGWILQEETIVTVDFGHIVVARAEGSTRKPRLSWPAWQTMITIILSFIQTTDFLFHLSRRSRTRSPHFSDANGTRTNREPTTWKRLESLVADFLDFSQTILRSRNTRDKGDMYSRQT